MSEPFTREQEERIRQIVRDELSLAREQEVRSARRSFSDDPRWQAQEGRS